MPGSESSEQTEARLRYCANCGKQLIVTGLEYWEYAGRIQLFCSERCYDRFAADPDRRLIASPFGES
jgi:YHS domain-containing protein